MSGGRDPTSDLPLLILSPVYEDWASAQVLVEQIDEHLSEAGIEAEILFVDDGSSKTPTPADRLPALRNLRRVTVLPLRRNIGHQRAIAIGLAFAERERPCSGVLVMDSDGEDSPQDISRLLQRMRETHGEKLIFAERTKRLENASFQILYQAYRQLHHLLTGISVRVGNFSIIPPAMLHRLVVVSELWNHYAAAVFASRIPHESIPTARARRIAGKSKMGFVALVAHGLAAMSVHSERLAVRVLAATLSAVALAVISLLVVTTIRLTTDWAIPGWASSVVLALLVLIAQLLTLSAVFVFTIMHRRNAATFLPTRDFRFYMDEPFDLSVKHVEQPATR